MDLESGAGLLHRLTSYTPDREWDVPVDDPRVRHDLAPNDPATRPSPVKRYDVGLPVTPLPRELPNPGVRVTLLFTCVGVGDYVSRSGGMPGAPVRIRQVTPKLND